VIATRRISIGFSASHHEKLIKSAGFARSQCSLRRRSRMHTFARISPSQKPSSSRSLSLFVDSSSTGEFGKDVNGGHCGSKYQLH
jgi:hypothetical protein